MIATMTTFDQGDDWESSVFGQNSKIDTPGLAGSKGRRENATTVSPNRSYIPYSPPGSPTREPIEVFDEEAFRPRVSYYINGRGFPAMLEDDPLEEASFLRSEKILASSHFQDSLKPES
jgi:hypothetical protein